VGYLGRAAILSARLKIHEEENIRQKGWASQHPAEARPPDNDPAKETCSHL
jgi:hypothetical protein